MDGVTTAASKAIYQALKDAKLLNATDYLIEDPRCRKHVRVIVILTSSTCPFPAPLRCSPGERCTEKYRACISGKCMGAACNKYNYGVATDICGRVSVACALVYFRRQDAPVWQKALKRLPDLAGVSLEAEKSPIFEELNLAWARHELISDGLEEVRARPRGH